MPINEQIRDREIRLISETGEQLGVVNTRQALERAYTAELDLVMISPGAKPPVCKIMDYGKHKFEQAKRQKEAKKNQKRVEVKEIQLSAKIDTGDFNTKLSHAKKFLEGGDKVKVSIRFRGREMAHTDIGLKIVLEFAEGCGELSSIERQPKLEGRSITMFLAPKVSKT